MVVGWAELGSLPKPHYDKTYGKEKRQLVQDDICEIVEEEQCSKTVVMCKQRALESRTVMH